MTNRLSAAVAALVFTAGAYPALADDNKTDDEADVRAAFDALIAAVNACDSEAAIALGHADETGYYPKRFALVIEREMDHANARFCETGGRYGWTPQIDQLVVHGDVALIIGTSDFTVTWPDGEITEYYVQLTQAWFRMGGEWRSRHTHFSTPLNAQTGDDKNE